ncbi:invasion associated locus B family protein [Aquibaculum arenosum]|uniref:Invasion associated locus B family protein n=1 Tax=Aquibaculum arenosum TaxID=3032591 RepID=A0ABT5YI93_9PROT|nr:invasion associated locus B family protein [Fodinicurvata sp. CAU 1616]MDF2094627.1 invasion associated locus B family protein [Fodinicurvata sp. CAU 1616]
MLERRISTLGLIAGALAFLALAQTPALAQGLPTEGAPGSDVDAEVEVQQFQDWSLRCLGEAEQRRCELVQPVDDPETGEPVMAMVIAPSGPDSVPVAWFVMPLGVLLPPGIGLSIDDAEPDRLPIRHCEPGGCLAPLELSDEVQRRLRSGVTLEVLAYDIDEQQVSVPLSLMGFTAGMEALMQ